jgi:hypothetical protein
MTILDATFAFAGGRSFFYSTHEGATFDWLLPQPVSLSFDGAPQLGNSYIPDECACTMSPGGGPLYVFGLSRIHDINPLGFLAYTFSKDSQNRTRIWIEPWRFTGAVSDTEIRPVDHIA